MTKILLYAVVMIAVPVAAQGPGLFVSGDIPAERVAPPDESFALRSRLATLDRDRLLDSLEDGSPLVLNLFPDAWFEARVEQTRAASPGSVFVYAILRDGGHATLFLHGGIVRGEAHSRSGVYTMRSTGRGGAGGVRIEQLDVSALPPVDHGTLGRTRDGVLEDWSSRTTAGGRVALSDGEAELAEDSGPDETVDLLVVYTPGAEASEEDHVDIRYVKLPGRAEIEATIIAEVEKTNQALANGGVGHRKFRLVGMERVDYNNMSDDLGLTVLGARKGALYEPDGVPSDGVLDEVHELRERYAADLVHLLVERAIGSCGIAQSNDLYDARYAEDRCSDDTNPRQCIVRTRGALWQRKSFSASAIPPGCTTQNVFSHELGHNLGLFHDRYSQGSWLSFTPGNENFPLQPYGFGYVNQNFDRSACFRTVMAYGDQCVDEGYTNNPRALMFSNPDSEIGSEEIGFDPAGVEGEEWTVELDGPVSAARAIDDVWDIVANLYSLTETGHAVPFMPSASDLGRQGFVRVVNHSAEEGEVVIEAFDDAGTAYEQVTLVIGANETLHFNSDDLEMGNPAKGLSAGVGAGEGDWRLKLTSLLDIEVLAYVRTGDGFLTAMHDLMPAAGPWPPAEAEVSER